MNSKSEIAQNVEIVRGKIARAAERVGRNPQEIILCVVTKTQSIASIEAVLAAGALDLGENYYQELRDKWDVLSSDIRWHFIGGLQSNKAKYLVGRCATIQSIGSLSLALEINRRAEIAGIVQSVLIEIKLAGGDERPGINIGAGSHLIEPILNMPNLRLEGLMAVAPNSDDKAILRQAMRGVKDLYDSLPNENRLTLSMGMTGDFEIAIEEGSNFVRIGSAIFGKREIKPKD